MRICVDKLSALRALRVYRRTGLPLPARRDELPVPNPSPHRRWTAPAIPAEPLDLAEPPNEKNPVDVLVPSAACRMQGSFVRCSSKAAGIPKRSYLDLRNGLHIPCPELLFLELASIMSTPSLALLGYELCGSYARDPQNPRMAEVVYGVEPATSVEKISAYLSKSGRRRQVLLARHALSYVADNAWSPLEAIVALLACLPAHELGYELGSVALNVRHEGATKLVELGCKGSRVPDIEIVGTCVGFNYDGHEHLDLESIRDAETQEAASDALSRVREKYLDDLRRNRELAALGKVILPVESSDLFMRGGLDAVMLEAALAIRELDGRDVSSTLAALDSASLTEARQQLAWSLLPWRKGIHHAREAQKRVPWQIV